MCTPRENDRFAESAFLDTFLPVISNDDLVNKQTSLAKQHLQGRCDIAA
jgi:hypothetical protein